MSYSIVANRPNSDCFICLQPFSEDEEEVVAHERLHAIHKNCLLKAIEQSIASSVAPGCPYCRKDITDISSVAVDELECPSSIIRQRYKCLAKFLKKLYSMHVIFFPPSSVVVEKMLENKISVTKYRVQTPRGAADVKLTPFRSAFGDYDYQIAIDLVR